MRIRLHVNSIEILALIDEIVQKSRVYCYRVLGILTYGIFLTEIQKRLIDFVFGLLRSVVLWPFCSCCSF